MRRSLIGLPVIGLLLLPVAGNVAADALPEAWRPYRWVAWPVAVVLVALMIYGEVRQRARWQRFPLGPVDEQEKRLRAAERDLAEAVYRQWTREAGVRSLRSPEPIRISWSSIGRPVAAEVSPVLATDAVVGRLLRVRGDIRRVAEVLRCVRARQLVVVGEPASGKSVTALLLTLDLLSGEPVPVLLAVSSWNPHQEDLHSWVARRIVEEYPALGNSDIYGPEVAMRLVLEKRVIPVLDGLDEMSTSLQRVAIGGIDRTVTDQYPLVLTCRSREYHEAVKENGRFLAHAAVVEIQAVVVEDAAAFLCGANPRSEHWQPVLDHLRANPDGPLARTLRSPLMIDLARTVYAMPTRDPAELSDTTSFPDQATVERHLLNAFLVVAYDNHPAPRGSLPASALIRYSAERAGEWLQFLATSVKARSDHDLAWWMLEHSVSRLTRGLVVGVVTVLVFGFTEGYFFGATAGLVFGVAFGLATGFAAGYGHVRKPSRIEIRFRGYGRSLIRRSAVSLVIGIIVSSAAGPIIGVLHMTVVLAILTTHLWLNAPPDLTTASSPMEVLEQDRRATLMLGAVLALTFALITFSGLIAGPEDGFTSGMMSGPIEVLLDTVVGTVMGGFLFGRAGAIAYGIAGGVIALIDVLVGGIDQVTMPWTFALAASVGYGLKIGCLAVLSRAWGAFAFTRLWLTLTGHLPLRLMRFLDDAHQRRGVLRQSGTVYQFRHEHLRDHLAAD